MKRCYIVLLGLCTVKMVGAQASPSNALAALVRQGTQCTNQSAGRTVQRECEYSVGALRFSIARLGTPNATVTAVRSDSRDDYFLSFDLKHGCVIVQRGVQLRPADSPSATREANFAFVSPVTGNVYGDLTSCGRRKKLDVQN